VLQEGERRRVQRIKLPVLGSRHGTLDAERFANLLGRVLAQMSLQCVTHLWVVAPVDTNARIIKVLKGILS
jgi:hypothetical protein